MAEAKKRASRNYDVIAAIAGFIIRLLDNEELRYILSQNALETAKELSVVNVAQKWEEILKGLDRKVHIHDSHGMC